MKLTKEEAKAFEVWRSNPANTKQVDQCLDLIHWDITCNGASLINYQSIRNLPEEQRMPELLKNAIQILAEWGLGPPPKERTA